MNRPILVMVDKMRAVRRSLGAHVRVSIGNVQFSAEGRSVRVTFEIDGTESVVEMTQAAARELATELRDGADEARNVDEKHGAA